MSITLDTPIAAYLRASSFLQEDSHERQEHIIKRFLLDQSLTIPAENWHSDFRARDAAAFAKDFQNLLSKIKRGQVKTVVVANLDRWGTADVDEFFKFRGVLLDHGCKLWSVEDGDLTSKEMTQIIMIIVKAEQSREYLKRMAKNIASGKERNAKAGHWNGGKCSPYGYDRLCVDATGKALWLLHYETPSRKLLFQVHPNGTPDFTHKPVIYEGLRQRPPKNKTDDNRLVPSLPKYGAYQCIDGDRAKNVGTFYRYLIEKPWSLKKTARALNDLGITYYGHHLTPQRLRALIPNEKYKGDMVWNKTTRAKYAISVKGQVKEVTPVKFKTGRLKTLHKLPEEWEIVPQTHIGLVDAQTWDDANRWMQEKCRKLRPRSNAFYLRPLLFCGHCGKPMSARMQQRTGKNKSRVRYPGYYCMSFKDAHRFDLKVSHWIPHAEVERWLFTKLRQMGVQVEQAHELKAILELTKQFLGDWRGIEAFFEQGVLEYLAEIKDFFVSNGFTEGELREHLDCIARLVPGYENGRKFFEVWGPTETAKVPMSDDMVQAFGTVREMLVRIDGRKVKAANAKLQEKKAQHEQYVERWMEATDEPTRIVAKRKIDQIVAEMERLELETVPFLDRYRDKMKELYAVRDRLQRLSKVVEGADADLKTQKLSEEIERITLYFIPYRPGGSGNRLDIERCAIKLRSPTSDTIDPSS